MTVTLVSGKHEGDRQFSQAPELRPGRIVTVRPHREEKYMFDILVRSVVPGVGAIKVVHVA